MDEQANTNKPKDEPLVSRTFFTIEIRGGSKDLAFLATRIIELGMEVAIEEVKLNLHGKKGAPELFLHRGPGRFEA